jgi:hypothetical protein
MLDILQMEAFARQGNLQNCLHVYKLLFEEQRHDNDDVRVAVVQACGKSRNIQLAINISNEISSCLTVKSTQAFLEACVATNVREGSLFAAFFPFFFFSRR